MARIGSLWITLLVALLVLTGLPSIPTAGAHQEMPRNDPDSLSGSGDVPTFRGDPAHTGVNPGPGW